VQFNAFGVGRRNGATVGGPEVVDLSGPNFAVVGNEVSFAATTTGATSQAWKVVDSAGNVVADGTGPTFEFRPESTGDFTIIVTAEDAAGTTDSEQLTLTVAQLGVVDNDLVVAGTDAADSIGVYTDAAGDLHVYMNGQHAGEFAGVTGEIIVSAGNGNDAIYISKFVHHNT
jgi:hypothetical protein